MEYSIIIAFITYFAVLVTIGFLSHHKMKTEADFIVGARSVNYFLTALSAQASDMSSWLFMGLPAAIFVAGPSYFWIALGLVMGMFLTWQFVAKRLRQQTEKLNSYTLSTYFERRYEDESGVIRVLTASMTLIFMTIYLSAGLLAMGLLVESVFGIDYYVGLTVATCVAVSYTFAGGFITIAWTDTFQALFLLCVIVIVPIFAFFNLSDGMATIASNASANGISLSPFGNFTIFSPIQILFMTCGWGLGYFGQPHIVTKFMGVTNPDNLTKSKYIGISWQIIALISSLCIGLVGIGYFSEGLSNPELVFVEMVKTLFHPFVSGFILCAVLAANLSTMDSQILVSASVISEDFYKHFIGRQVSQTELVRVSRGGVVVIALIALGIAFNKNASVLETVFFAWSGLGSSFGPLILMSLYSKQANRYGAMAGIVVGGVVSTFWILFAPEFPHITVPAMIPAFILSALSIYVVSRLTKD